MTTDEIMGVLRDHEAEIRALGVTRLALFGSTVRGEARPDSDVDILFDNDGRRDFSLLDHAGVQVRLSDLLGREVEAVRRDRLKRFLKDYILAEAVEVFPEFGKREPPPEDQPMPRRTPRQWLEDMLEAIAAIEGFIRGRSVAEYRSDLMLRSAVERRIEIISEASRRLPDQMKSRRGHLPWHEIAAIGNGLRHAYPDVVNEEIWRIATTELEPLKRAVEAMIAEVEAAKDG